MQTVGVLGGAGFIGSYVTQKFLNEGYTVKVSTTDLAKPEKYQHLHQLSLAENLTIREVDVTNEAALGEFLRDCNIVVHSGTPFQLATENPQEEVFQPTVHGTENFLKVVSQTPSVQKVVFVASVGALNTAYPMPVPHYPADHQYTEADEPYLDPESIPYAQAKYYADQAVRTFVATYPQPGFEIVSVSPTGVMGKPLSARDDSTSVGLQYLIKHKIAPNPFVQMMFDHDVEMAIVSVSDVAEGIFRAATTAGLHGRNYLLNSESYKMSDMTLMLNGKAPVNAARNVYSNALATQELGMQFQPAQVPLNEWADV
ncbi:NAD-dependent epimerase/dehydratase family protein [Spirosoma areae]